MGDCVPISTGLVRRLGYDDDFKVIAQIAGLLCELELKKVLTVFSTVQVDVKIPHTFFCNFSGVIHGLEFFENEKCGLKKESVPSPLGEVKATFWGGRISAESLA